MPGFALHIASNVQTFSWITTLGATCVCMTGAQVQQVHPRHRNTAAGIGPGRALLGG